MISAVAACPMKLMVSDASATKSRASPSEQLVISYVPGAVRMAQFKNTSTVIAPQSVLAGSAAFANESSLAVAQNESNELVHAAFAIESEILT